MDWTAELLKHYCKRLGGEPQGDVCMVEGFPAPMTQAEWEYCAAVTHMALDDYDKDSFVARFSVDDAKRAFTPLESFDQDTIKRLVTRFKEKKAVCPPWLEICSIKNNYFCTIAHEGRHRIQAAKEAGITTIPVIFRMSPYPCNK